ncbi:MAG: N-acetylornithine carbamoyltransferase [Crocinitomicaceae bacterium]|nr:N-acetylornithine carbamoyltransferase [Crocinitomicaceae bacterium]
MKKFSSIEDIEAPEGLIKLALDQKSNPHELSQLGKNKTLGLLFFNPSLRTRMSTQKAAMNLGMDVIVMNLNSDSWTLEFEDGSTMNSESQEHIREAAAVISQYCDIIGVRTFPSFNDREEDYSEVVLNGFVKHASVPIISLESATRHPLQSLADMMTIEEHKVKKKPKIVLSWVPHPKALPQAVANSFVEWAKEGDFDLVITHPNGFELEGSITNGVEVVSDQAEAFKDADFIYAKNWSSYEDYGKIGEDLNDWMISPERMAITNQGKFMHCLPVRRNVVVHDDVIDSQNSLVIEQAENRIYAAQAVLIKMLNDEN